MVQTSIVRPNGILKDYIQSYELREFDTHGHGFEKPIHAFHEAMISLFIDSPFPIINTVTDYRPHYLVENKKKPFSGVMGMQSFMKGSFAFNGCYKIFNIQFKPMGFSSIFKIPASMILDRFYEAEDLCTQEIRELNEQLHEVKGIHEMVAYAERFLEKKLSSNTCLWKATCLIKASEFLLNHPNFYSIEQLSHQSNMSLKTFERKFSEQVGMGPKLFARIRRFNLALDMKLYQPESSWMDVCIQSGYYDQMHLIKDFKAFTTQSPSAFFKTTPPVFENYSYL